MVHESAEKIMVRKRHLGDFLRKCRDFQGMTQRYVADQLGYSTPQFISNWERGLASPPPEVLPAIIKIYDIPPLKLVDAIHEYREAWLQCQKRNLLQLVNAR